MTKEASSERRKAIAVAISSRLGDAGDGVLLEAEAERLRAAGGVEPVEGHARGDRADDQRRSPGCGRRHSRARSAGERPRRRPCRGIGGDAGNGGERMDRGDVDDAAATRRANVGKVGAADAEDRGEVDRDGAVPLGVGDVLEPLAGRVDAGASSRRRRARRRGRGIAATASRTSASSVRSASRKMQDRAVGARRGRDRPRRRGRRRRRAAPRRARYSAVARPMPVAAPVTRIAVRPARRSCRGSRRASPAARPGRRQLTRSTRSSPPSPRRTRRRGGRRQRTRTAVAEADHLLELGGDDDEADALVGELDDRR